MMRVFGGREQYLNAPLKKVEEQKLVWMADLKAASERQKRENDALSKLK